MATENPAISAASFTNSLGINTHLDFTWTAYGNLSMVQTDLGYLGIHNIRDSIAGAGDLSPFVQIHNALGSQFDFYLVPDRWSSQLQQLASTMPAGSINYIEGANEPDVQGPSMAEAQSAQTGIYSAAHQSLGVPVIQTSFGNVNDYGSTGDQSAYADYGNTHTYFGSGNNPAWDNNIQTMNANAQRTTPGKPVIDTETGYYTTGNQSDPHTVDETVQAKYTLDDTLDAYKAGNPLTYLYELLDTGTGDGNPQNNFGLFHTDGSPKLAVTAIHNLTSLLSDPKGVGTSPGSLAYDLSGMQSTDNSLLMQKSDGTYWLALWNDTRLSGPNSPAEVSVSPHNVTLNLGSAATSVQVFDPLSGTSAVQSLSNASTAQISVPDHPVLVEIDPSGSGGSTLAQSSPSSTTATSPTPAASGGQPASGGGTSGAGAGPDPVVTVPGMQTINAGQTAPISGVSVSDAWATNNPGVLALNVTSGTGAITMQDGNGSALSGSGSTGVHVSGTLAQINADLATLQYKAVGSDDSITVDVWDQSGAEAAQSVAIKDPPAGGASPASPAGGAAVTIDPGDASPVVLASNTTIQATAGDHMTFVGGTQDRLSATGGTETVQAYQGSNTISTGAGDDTIRFSGSGNTIDAGSGNNTLEDSGGSNTIVLPTAGQGSDNIFGYVLQNADKLDLRAMLGQTGWNGDAATLGNYVQVGLSGDSAVISVTPSGAGSTSYNVATLQGSGPLSLAGLLAHSVT